MILGVSLTSAWADQSADEAAIRDIQAHWDDAWNRHDVQALGALVADDVRFVNVAGLLLKSRAEFQQLQTRTHAMMFKESVRTVTATQIKFITPEIAVAHVSWGMRGDKDPDGTLRQPRNGVMMQLLVKRDGKWTVVAAQNTNVTQKHQ
jgi:uncharacterized protein (TIGR02246 family)